METRTTRAMPSLLTSSLRYAFDDDVATGFLGSIAGELAPTGLALTLLSASGVGETVLAPAVMHYGVVQKGDTYTAQIKVAIPRELEGSFYVRVYANANNGLAENGGTANNVRAAAAQLQVTLAPAACSMR